MTEPPRSFTGRAPRRTTRWTVRASDTAARHVIAVGGIGTILAVSAVAVLLIWVVAPLFLGAALDREAVLPPADTDGPPATTLMSDEYRLMTAAVTADGRMVVRRLDDGSVMLRRRLGPPDADVTTVRLDDEGDSVIIGTAQGEVYLGRMGFTTRFVDAAQLQQRPRPGRTLHIDDGLAQWAGDDQVRVQSVNVEPGDRLRGPDGDGVRLIDHVTGPRGDRVALLTDAGRLQLLTIREQRNLMTGQVTRRAQAVTLPYEHTGQPVIFLGLSGLGDSLHLLHGDGLLLRYDLRRPDQAHVIERHQTLASDARVTAAGFLVGRTTLMIGDSRGTVSAWFLIRPRDADTTDGAMLVRGHTLPPGSAAVTAFGPSRLGRMTAVGYADGEIRLYYATTQRLLATIAGDGSAVTALAITPKDDGLLAATSQSLTHWSLDPRHPEASFAALFTPVWYEGYPAPAHVWQSSAGTDDFEPKFGLLPLIFGTLKATFYSMIIAVPLALLAAIYTSEFLHPRLKARIKPTIELMASLPSVVLGFLAGLVIAPLVERIVPTVIAMAVLLPLTFMAGAYLWQLLPPRVTSRVGHWRLMLMAAAIPLAVAMAIFAGPNVEQWLFAGDTARWLDGQVGTGATAWLLLLLPLTAVIAAMLIGRFFNDRLRNVGGWSRAACAAVDLAKFLTIAACAAGAALVAGLILQALGLDPRGPWVVAHVDWAPVGTFVQRNALVVGFVMGFAVIPIIYTIADDALSAVPEHLRSASLATGATPWQTAIRVIVPTAMSGLFSAVMIGLGRAVGETMIVLMAAGNTPVLQANLFNGFRTLSANIAVELPEAVRNSTHYRTLFLAALTLFAMTFVVNTVAEMVRLRFRRRAVQL
jgi:phosphate transport system permease protein